MLRVIVLFLDCLGVVDPVRVHLIKSFCLPLLVYCVGALRLKRSAIQQWSICWNNAFRRIFNYKRIVSLLKVFKLILGHLTSNKAVRFT